MKITVKVTKENGVYNLYVDNKLQATANNRDDMLIALEHIKRIYRPWEIIKDF